MSRDKFKFKKLLNEYKSESYELQYVDEVLRDAYQEFDEYYRKFCDKKKVNLAALNKKHAGRVEYIFSNNTAIKKAVDNKMRQDEFDTKDLFKQIARKFHPDKIKEDDPKHQEYKSIFQRASNAITEAKWGELLDIVDQYDLDLKDYTSACDALRISIKKVKKEIKKKKDTYAWLLHECERDEDKDQLMKRYLNHVYIDYTDPT